MAKIINYSSYPIELFGGDSSPKKWVLPGGYEVLGQAFGWQTPPEFNCLALRGASDDGVTVFESDQWWEVLTQEAYIYDDGNNNVSLHCIPLHRPLGAGKPSVPGYKPFNENLITVPFDPDIIVLPQDVPVPELQHGEINSKHPLFGKFIRTGSNISVRLKTYPGRRVSSSELEDQKAIWKQKIESVWNAAPPHWLYYSIRI